MSHRADFKRSIRGHPRPNNIHSLTNQHLGSLREHELSMLFLGRKPSGSYPGTCRLGHRTPSQSDRRKQANTDHRGHVWPRETTRWTTARLSQSRTQAGKPLSTMGHQGDPGGSFCLARMLVPIVTSRKQRLEVVRKVKPHSQIPLTRHTSAAGFCQELGLWSLPAEATISRRVTSYSGTR